MIFLDRDVSWSMLARTSTRAWAQSRSNFDRPVTGPIYNFGSMVSICQDGQVRVFRSAFLGQAFHFFEIIQCRTLRRRGENWVVNMPVNEHTFRLQVEWTVRERNPCRRYLERCIDVSVFDLEEIREKAWIMKSPIGLVYPALLAKPVGDTKTGILSSSRLQN